MASWNREDCRICYFLYMNGHVLWKNRLSRECWGVNAKKGCLKYDAYGTISIIKRDYHLLSQERLWQFLFFFIHCMAIFIVCWKGCRWRTRSSGAIPLLRRFQRPFPRLSWKSRSMWNTEAFCAYPWIFLWRPCLCGCDCLRNSDPFWEYVRAMSQFLMARFVMAQGPLWESRCCIYFKYYQHGGQESTILSFTLRFCIMGWLVDFLIPFTTARPEWNLRDRRTVLLLLRVFIMSVSEQDRPWWSKVFRFPYRGHCNELSKPLWFIPYIFSVGKASSIDWVYFFLS